LLSDTVNFLTVYVLSLFLCEEANASMVSPVNKQQRFFVNKGLIVSPCGTIRRQESCNRAAILIW